MFKKEFWYITASLLNAHFNCKDWLVLVCNVSIYFHRFFSFNKALTIIKIIIKKNVEKLIKATTTTTTKIKPKLNKNPM